MSFDFENPKKQAKKRVKKHDDAPKTEYVQRNQAEAKRRKLATDGSFFSVWSFHTADELQDFCDFISIDYDSKYVDARKLEKELVALGVDKTRKRAFSKGFAEPDIKADNPYKNVVYSGNAESDARAEFMALFDALNSVQPRDEYKSVVDSRFWVAFVFHDAAELEKFLDDWSLSSCGYQYVDGSKAFKAIMSRAAK